MRNLRGIFVLLLALILTASACSDSDDSGSTSTVGDDQPATTTAGTATTDASQAATTAPSDESKPPIVIGLVTDQSGRFVTFGKDIVTATEYAVEVVNAGGGVNGSMIELEIVDTGGEPPAAVVAYTELADEGVFAISGPLSSGEAEVVFPQAPTVGVPIITGTANKEGITDAGLGWAFRNTATNTALFTVAMDAFAEEYDVGTAVLVFDEEEPVTAAAAKFAIPGVAPQVGVELVGDPITFTRGTTDFSTVVQRIRETDADALIIMSAPAEAGLLAVELARQGEVRPVLGHPAQAGSSFFEQGGTDINNWVIPSIFDGTLDDADTATYVAEMQVRDSEPPTVAEAANYYDNILLLASVMSEAGIDGSMAPDDVRIQIRDGLAAVVDFDGVAGLTTFLPNGDAEKTVYVNVVIEGVMVPLE